MYFYHNLLVSFRFCKNFVITYCFKCFLYLFLYLGCVNLEISQVVQVFLKFFLRPQTPFPPSPLKFFLYLYSRDKLLIATYLSHRIMDNKIKNIRMKPVLVSHEGFRLVPHQKFVLFLDFYYIFRGRTFVIRYMSFHFC